MSEKTPATLTQSMRRMTDPLLKRAGALLARLGIHPDAITVAGTLLTGVAALCLAAGEFLAGGVILLLSLPLDALDGAVARAMGRKDVFGMVLDSSLDRYADGLIFGALAFYSAQQDQFAMLFLAILAMIGSFSVSYVRARADDPIVAVSVKIGLFSRMERVVVVLIMIWGMALTGEALFLLIGLVFLAVGTNYTAAQRLLYVRRVLRERESSEAH